MLEKPDQSNTAGNVLRDFPQILYNEQTEILGDLCSIFFNEHANQAELFGEKGLSVVFYGWSEKAIYRLGEFGAIFPLDFFAHWI